MARLIHRDREARPERVVVGERVRLRESSTRFPWIRVQPAPNAPLLKRIVRYPYRLDTAYARRHQVFEPAAVGRPRLEATVPAARLAQQDRGQMVVGNPLRSASTGYQRRGKLPTVDEWLGGETK